MAATGPLDACPHINLWYVDLLMFFKVLLLLSQVLKLAS